MRPVDAKQRFVRTTFEGAPMLTYDRVRRRIVHEITDYALFLHDLRKLSPLTIDQETSNLVCFWSFLSSNGLGIRNVNDRVVARFRDEDLKLVLAQPGSKGSERTAKTTVNQKLRSIYTWLWWLADGGKCTKNLIGPTGCRVTSGAPPRSSVRAADAGWIRRSMHPLLFPGTGVSSKHRTSFEATLELYDAVTQTIMEGERVEYVRVRDCLFLDVARHLGFRRGSIASLTVDQFDRDTLVEHRRDTIRILPSKQKFGYDNEFEFPIWLALQVADFIEGPRKQLLEDRGLSEESAPREVFLSERSCRPITVRAMTHSIRPAMRHCGAPKGAVIHAFRGLFANEEIEREIDERLRRGLDTSTVAICAAVGMRLGHRDHMSLFAYVTRAQSRRGLEAAAATAKQIAELKRRIRELERERDAGALSRLA